MSEEKREWDLDRENYEGEKAEDEEMLAYQRGTGPYSKLAPHSRLKQDLAAKLCMDCEWRGYLPNGDLACFRVGQDGASEQCETYRTERERGRAAKAAGAQQRSERKARLRGEGER